MEGSEDSMLFPISQMTREHNKSRSKPVEKKNYKKLKLRCTCKKYDSNKREFHHCKYPISNCDFKYGTVFICKPGYYYLTCDISYKPSENSDIAILIKSNDVTLDLCGHRLKQTGSEEKIVAIRIHEGSDNVTILGNNGIIRDFTGIGIQVDGFTNKIKIDNLKVTDCGFSSSNSEDTDFVGGIAFGGPNNHSNLVNPDPVIEVQITNCKILNNNYVGLFLFKVNNVNISGCNVNGTKGSTRYGISTVSSENLSCFSSKNINITDSTFNDMTNIEPDSLDSLWFRSSLYNSKNVNITRCTFNNNNINMGIVKSVGISGGQITALYIVGSDTVYLNQCTFNDNMASHRVYGMAIAGSNNIFLNNCSANNNKLVCDADKGGRTDLRTYGHYCWDNSKNIVYNNCTANGNTSELLVGCAAKLQSVYTTGFDLYNVNDSTIINSISNNNSMVINNELIDIEIARVAGVIISNGSKSNLIQNLQSKNNRVVDKIETGIGEAYGIWVLIKSSDNVITNSIISGNTHSGISLGDKSGSLNDVRNTVIDGNKILGNFGPGIKIYPGTDEVVITVIRDNLISSNAGGISDSQPSTVLLGNNIFNN